jgi:hypothetical protein
VPWSGGLLGPTATDTHYAKELDLIKAAELVNTRGNMWEADEADVKASDRAESIDEYLERVEQSAAAFLDRDELHGRDVVMTTRADCWERRASSCSCSAASHWARASS